MKIYLEDSVGMRLRLGQDEFQRLCQGSCLDAKFDLWGLSEIHLTLCADGSVPTATPVVVGRRTPYSVDLRVHPEVLHLLSTPSKKGYLARIVLDGTSIWSLGIEVDLKKA